MINKNMKASINYQLSIDCGALKFLNSRLTELYGIPEAKSIIIMTIKHYSGLSLSEILLGKTIAAEAGKQIVEALEKVLMKIPVQYVLGETEFYGRKFFVNENVLIPRCETEELVDLVIRENRSKAVNILDVGVGSGCIAISLDCELPGATVYAVDISVEALKVAEKNCNHNKANVLFAEYDILGDAKFPYNTKFDIIVSNPPYVRMSEKKYIHENVLEHEPHIALFVEDSSPLIYYEACLRFAGNRLADEGKIYVEINEALGNETLILFRDYGFDAILIQDLSGKNRIIKAKRTLKP
jgi:release factor glutamine methyltransferase